MSTGQGTGAINGDFFDYTGVKSCMDSLDNKFAEFAELLRTINDYMNENINIDHYSAIFGLLGEKFLNDWNENASTFGDFYENFSVWSQLMVNIMNQYGDFDDAAVRNVIGQNQASGATLAGVTETRAAIWENNQLQDFKDANLVAGANGVVEEGVVKTENIGNGLVQCTYIDGTVVTYGTAGDGSVERMIVENVDGTIQGITFIDDGGRVVEHYDATGKAVSSDIINPKGVVVATRTYNEDLNDTITFYNADGSEETVKIYEDVSLHGDGMKNVTTTDMLLNSDKLTSSGLYHDVKGEVNTTNELVYMNKVGAIDNNSMNNNEDWNAGERTAKQLGMHYNSGDSRIEWRHEDLEQLNDDINSTAVTDQAIIRQNIASRGGQVTAVEAHNIDDVKAYFRDDAVSQNFDHPTALYNSGYNTTMPQTQNEDNVVVSPTTSVVPGYVPNQKNEDVHVTTLPTTPGNNGNVTSLPYVPSDNETQVVYLGETNTPVALDSDRVVSL